jgi:dTDP-4-dehydrorhamnose reductase
MTRILLTGKTGQVGYELERSLQGLGEIVALDRSQMDLSNLAQVRDAIRAIKPNLIVNPAAYTAVDKAESEPELAMRINGEAPGVMAEEAKKLGAAMIHYSTDYVFDGGKSTPYVETDSVNPLNVYGATKLAGERAVQAAGIPHLILRTSWVYGMRGKNFLHTILRMAQERDELRIVADQHGAPTWSRTIADTTAHIVTLAKATENVLDWWQEGSGIYHLTAQGLTTWYGFAQAILENSVPKVTSHLLPIETRDYPTTAKRPIYSAMACDKLTNAFCCDFPEWNRALKLCLK